MGVAARNDRAAEDPTWIALPRVHWLDIVVVIGLLVGSAVYQHARTRGERPCFRVSGDVAASLCILKAQDHPELFTRDPVYKDVGSFNLARIHSPLYRALEQVMGDYGSAAVAILGAQAFLYTLGWYILGRVILGGPFWAFLFLVTNLAKIPLLVGTWWGIFFWTNIRFTFQGLLAFLLIFAFRYRRRPDLWPWVMVFAGLLHYAHPVSGPAIGLGLWLGFWPFLTREKPWRNRRARMFGLGLVFLALIAPFLYNFVSTSGLETSVTDTGSVLEAVRAKYGDGNNFSMNLPVLYQRFMEEIISNGLLPAAVAATLLLLALCRSSSETPSGGERRVYDTLKLLAAWSIGVLVVGVVIPSLDHGWAAMRGRMPYQLELARNLRYSVPLMIMVIFVALVEINRRAHSRQMKWGIGVLTIGMVMVFTSLHPPHGTWSTHAMVKPWLLGIEWPGREAKEEHEAWHQVLDAIRDTTPAGSVVLSSDFGVKALAIRYYSERPLAFCIKDSGSLIYYNHEGLIVWHQRQKAMTRIAGIEDRVRRVEALFELARQVEADYLLLNEQDRPEAAYLPDSDEIVFQNARYWLVALGKTTVSTGGEEPSRATRKSAAEAERARGRVDRGYRKPSAFPPQPHVKRKKLMEA